jgi:hypothetical protein
MSQQVTTAKCRRCGHHLRAAASIKTGYSKRCLRLARAEAIETVFAGYTEAQQDKALTLMASGDLKPAGRPGVWQAPSSDRSTIYDIAQDACSCPARRRCYHQAARQATLAVLALAA